MTNALTNNQRVFIIEKTRTEKKTRNETNVGVEEKRRGEY